MIRAVWYVRTRIVVNAGRAGRGTCNDTALINLVPYSGAVESSLIRSALRRNVVPICTHGPTVRPLAGYCRVAAGNRVAIRIANVIRLFSSQQRIAGAVRDSYHRNHTSAEKNTVEGSNPCITVAAIHRV